MLKTGIISTAKIAQTQVIPAGLNAQGVEICGIASRDLALARRVAGHFGIPEC